MGPPACSSFFHLLRPPSSLSTQRLVLLCPLLCVSVCLLFMGFILIVIASWIIGMRRKKKSVSSSSPSSISSVQLLSLTRITQSIMLSGSDWGRNFITQDDDDDGGGRWVDSARGVWRTFPFTCNPQCPPLLPVLVCRFLLTIVHLCYWIRSLSWWW